MLSINLCAKIDFGDKDLEDFVLKSLNIGNDFSPLAKKAGIYTHIWKPEELEIANAKDLIEPLSEGLKKLKENPMEYTKLGLEGGFVPWRGFVIFVEEYLKACVEWPKAKIEVFL